MSEKKYGHRVTEYMMLWCDECEESVEFPPGELTPDGEQEVRSCEEGHAQRVRAWFSVPPSEAEGDYY